VLIEEEEAEAGRKEGRRRESRCNCENGEGGGVDVVVKMEGGG
jgi:hypothetical protein